MANLSIIQPPNPILQTVTKNIEAVTPEVVKLIKEINYLGASSEVLAVNLDRNQIAMQNARFSTHFKQFRALG